jgi:hypothetical protein
MNALVMEPATMVRASAKAAIVGWTVEARAAREIALSLDSATMAPVIATLGMRVKGVKRESVLTTAPTTVNASRI